MKLGHTLPHEGLWKLQLATCVLNLPSQTQPPLLAHRHLSQLHLFCCRTQHDLKLEQSYYRAELAACCGCAFNRDLYLQASTCMWDCQMLMGATPSLSTSVM